MGVERNLSAMGCQPEGEYRLWGQRLGQGGAGLLETCQPSFQDLDSQAEEQARHSESQ